MKTLLIISILSIIVGCTIEEMENGSIKVKFDNETVFEHHKKVDTTGTQKPIEKVSPDVNAEVKHDAVVQNNVTTPMSDGTSFMMCDKPLIVKEKASSDRTEWGYRYVVTDGFSDDITDGFYFYSNNSYDVGDELMLTD